VRAQLVTRRVLAAGLVAAALYAAALSAAAPAEDQAPEARAEPAAEVITPPAAAEPAAPDEEAPPAAEEPPTPTPPPADTSQPAPPPAPDPTDTPDTTPKPATAPKPAAPAQLGSNAQPGANPQPGSTAQPRPTAQSGPTAGPGPRKRPVRKHRPANSPAGAGDAQPCSSPSTSGRGCEESRGEQHKKRVGPIPSPAPPPAPTPRLTNPDRSPAPSNPGYSLATPGAARVGVPNFFIDKFRIPPFLLPIYQAAGMQYGVRWEILAAINEIETDYGRNLNISSAGAVGWMQFMPPTWDMYGVDANGDGVKDPFNPVDAIFAAARYLRAAGAESDIRRAVFAYNHADWYVDSVLMRAQIIGGLPGDLVGSLTGLTQGRFPVHAKATYAGQLKKRGKRVREGNAAMVVESDQARRGIEIFSREGAPVIAVNDGRVVKIGRDKRLGRFVTVQDVYGNTYTYARLGEVSRTYPAPKNRSRGRHRPPVIERDARPARAASKTRKPAQGRAVAGRAAVGRAATGRVSARDRAAAGFVPDLAPAVPLPAKERLFAHPRRPAAFAAGGASQLAAGGASQLAAGGAAQLAASGDGATQDAPLGFDARDFRPKPLVKGARVIGGTILGRLGSRTPASAPHMLFEIRPAGRGAPRIDPKPILDGWKLLESTAVYRAKGKNPFFGGDAENPSIGQLMLLSRDQLARRVLNDPRVQIYGCGMADIRSGQIDRRVLATMLYLAASGLKPTISSLKCGHGYLTSSGNVSEHSTGTAMDIAAVNGIVITPGTQGPGSITDVTIRALLKLQGTMKPHQIISLMTFDGADNTFAMGDHDDHIHVGWRPLYGQNQRAARQIDAVLKPDQWIKLIDRLGDIDNPTVRAQPSRFAVKVHKRHRGD
jgi:Transglycosylase SLT domain/Peptidase family M23